MCGCRKRRQWEVNNTWCSHPRYVLPSVVITPHIFIVLQVHSMMEEGELALHSSDINTKLRAEGLPASEWRFDFILNVVRPSR